MNMSPSTFQSRVFTSHWVPATPASDKLIVILHGRGDSFRGFLGMPDELALPAVNYLMVNAPDDYFGGFSWYDLPPDQGPGIERSRALLDQLFDELQAYGIDAGNTLVFGFSQGCLMALEWGTRTRRRLAGFVGISGYCYDAEAIARDVSDAGRQTPFLITHGTRDHVVPFAPTDRQIQFLQHQGLTVEFHAFDKAHTIDPHRELPLLRSWIQRTLWPEALNC